MDTLHAAVARVAKSPEIVAKMDTEGTEMVASRPAEFSKLIALELARYKKIVTENNIKAED